MTPLARSVEILRAEGWHVETVEQTLRVGRKTWKRDLLGAFDLACFPMVDAKRDLVLLVQVTSASNLSARRKKIAAEPRVAWARMAGCVLELHGWRKNTAGRWVLTREDVS